MYPCDSQGLITSTVLCPRQDSKCTETIRNDHGPAREIMTNIILGRKIKVNIIPVRDIYHDRDYDRD